MALYNFGKNRDRKRNRWELNGIKYIPVLSEFGRVIFPKL